MKNSVYLYSRNLKHKVMNYTLNIPATTPKTVNAVIAWVNSHDFVDKLYFDFHHLDMSLTRFSFGEFSTEIFVEYLQKEFGNIYFAAAKCLNAQK